MTTETSSAPARDLADIGPENLWAVWSRTAQFLVALRPHLDPVSFHWVLASPGEMGLAEISGGYPTSLIAAVPLSTLRAASESFAFPSESKTPGWVRTAFGLGGSHTFSLVREDSGTVRFEKGRRRKKGAQVLIQGNTSDFISILNRGEQILQEKDWAGVFDDIRAEAQQGPVKWFKHKKNPKAAASIQQFFEDQE